MRYIYGYAVSVTQLSINSHSVVFNKTQPILNQLVTASQQHLLSLSRKIQKHRFPNGLQSFEIKKQYKPFSFDLCVAIKDSKSLVTCSSLYKLKPFPYSNSPSCFILCLLSLKRSRTQEEPGSVITTPSSEVQGLLFGAPKATSSPG